MKIIVALFILGILVIVHEFGHFISAKIFKMPVLEFSVGIGPELFSYDGKKTKYAIRGIPIGGFVSIDGMEAESQAKDGFNDKSFFARLVVLAAGVIMNFLFGYFLIFANNIIYGQQKISEMAVIGDVARESSNINILEKNDKIIYINGQKVEKWLDISKIINENSNYSINKKFDIIIERDNNILNLTASAIYDEKSKRFFLGIVPQIETVKYSFGNCIIESGKQTKNAFLEIFRSLKMIFSGKVKSEDISGPIGIIRFIGQSTSAGIQYVVFLAAMLSLNLGIMNLLPFPALDGGRILFLFLELIPIKNKKIRMTKQLQETIHKIGFVILFLCIIYISIKDVSKIILR